MYKIFFNNIFFSVNYGFLANRARVERLTTAEALRRILNAQSADGDEWVNAVNS